MKESANPNDNRSLASDLGDLGNSLRNMVRSEINLAKAEFKEASTRVGKNSAQVAISLSFAAFGILPLTAFFVIRLGELLTSNYWLSSLIVAAVYFVFGGLMAFVALKRMKLANFTAPETRESVTRETEHVGKKVREITSKISEKRRPND